MNKLTICYSPGSRGDFLAKVLFDEVNFSPTFISFPLNGNYQKIHLHEIVKLYSLPSEYYSIKINIFSVKDFFNSWILTNKKNKDFYLKNHPYIFKNIYDIYKSCFRAYIFMIEQDQLFSSFNFSDQFDFANFKDIQKIEILYQNFRNQNLTDQHVEYILKNNQLQDDFIYNSMQSDPNLIKTLDLLEFEVGISSVDKGRKFSFEEYIVSDHHKDYLTLDNYGFIPSN
jgi:hypothetical protein